MPPSTVDVVGERSFPGVEGSPTGEQLPLTSSSFDDEDLVDDHPVPDEGPITHSSFDDEDVVDDHRVQDEGPLTSSSFDEEDRFHRAGELSAP
jgi:hypothetical protein